MKKTSRTFKRFAAITSASLLAACMVAPMAGSAVVDTDGVDDTGSITITATKGEKHSAMAAYQIFAATKQGDKIRIDGWGDGVDLAGLETDLEAFKEVFEDIEFVSTGEKAAASAQKVSDEFAKITDESTDAEKLARIIADNVVAEKAVAATIDATSGEISVSGLPTGYYIVLDTEEASKDKYSAYTLGILEVVAGDTTLVNTKLDFPKFDKQIGDINDTDTAAGTYSYNEAADHDILDYVPFRLIGTVPSNIDKYDVYNMTFHDNLQDSVFDLNLSSVTVTYYSSSSATGVDVTGAFTKTAPGTDNTTFSGTHEKDKTENLNVSCTDITAIDIENYTLTAGGYFVVDYTAQLKSTANLGATGNWNSAYLEYSNNPNYVSGGDAADNTTGNSPEDSTVAFTYQIIVDKIDGVSKEPLPGATFTLKKVLKDGTKKTVSVATANAGATFVFTGIDDGQYILTEEETPSVDYNGIAPITFNVTAGEIQLDGSEALGSLESSNDKFALKTEYYEVTGENATKAEGTIDKVSLKATVENTKGTQLPGTGGIGTTVFYLGGGAMVAVAGIYLISKKRMKNTQE